MSNKEKGGVQLFIGLLIIFGGIMFITITTPEISRAFFMSFIFYLFVAGLLIGTGLSKMRKN